MTQPGPAPPPAGGAPDDLNHSPLEASHLSLGAKMVGFGGWRMPLNYPGGTIAEHRACRSDAVAFDVSHLGTVRVGGPGSFDLLQAKLSNDLRKIGTRRAQYSHLLDDRDGSVTDDVIVWWSDDDSFDVMPNASNTSRVRAAIGGTDTTPDRAVIAIQGPNARSRLETVSSDAARVAHFCVSHFEWRGALCKVAGTGYTGEDGVECAVPVGAAPSFWDALIGAGITPAGLGARDTLRLEAGLPLHGHELGPGITPLQAGLGWVVGWKKDAFPGRAALVKEKEAGPARRLRALVSDSRRPPREGYAVEASGERVGVVTSGNFSPVLGRGIALALIDESAGVEQHDTVCVRAGSSEMGAVVTTAPFVRGGKPADQLAIH